MWYNGVYSCGHEGRINVVGKESDRQWKINKHFEGICESCRKKQYEEMNKEAMEKSKEYNFPELVGTEKQIEWANAIRLDFYLHFSNKHTNVDEIIMTETETKFWINNRMELKSMEFVKDYFRAKEIEKYNKEMISNDSVKPEEIKHSGVVEIIQKKNEIRLYYEKDFDFIKLVKSKNYKWDSDNLCWYRELSETTGNFSDRAAEIGHELLKNGFVICIHDKEITDKAISGTYTREHTRWIISTKNSLLAIIWKGENDSLYKKVRKIKGSEWDSSGSFVVVDISHYNLLEEFAFENGFRFTKAAQEKINNYKKQLEDLREVKVK